MPTPTELRGGERLAAAADGGEEDEYVDSDAPGDGVGGGLGDHALGSGQKVADGAVCDTDVGRELPDRDSCSCAGALHEAVHEVGVHQAELGVDVSHI